MSLRRLVQLIYDAARHQPEVARIDRQVDVGETRQYPVEGRVAQAEQPPFLAPHPASVDDVVSLQVGADKVGDRLGRVLKVPVHQHHGITADVVERGGQSRLVTEVARERHHDEPRLAGGRAKQRLARAIPAPVVDHNDLVRAARDSVQHGGQAPEQLRNQLDLVVDRHGYGKTERAHRGRLPLKYTMCHSGMPSVPTTYGSNTSVVNCSANNACQASSGRGESPRSRRASSRAGPISAGRTSSRMWIVPPSLSRRARFLNSARTS